MLRKAVPALVFLFASMLPGLNANAQNGSRISGKVTDATDGLPIPGVTILVVGQGKGVITDREGRYEIFNIPADASLQFSSVGKITQTIPVAGKTVIDVALVDQITMLEDVTVVGYGTQKKDNVISAMDNIKVEELKLPIRTISASLAGRLAGVMAVQSSGEPGYDGATFWIRGINTFSGSATPLVLIDGVERTMDNIDTEDIADFAILKDASATALYGVRGANGVVLITTKRGQAGKPKVNLRVEQAFSSPVAMPEFVGGVEFMELVNEARRNDGQGIVYSQQKIENTRNKVDPYYYPDVNWTKEMIRYNSPTQKVSLNISGGSEKMRYYVNAGFLNQNGMFKNFKYYSFNNNINVKRYNFRTNVDMDVTNTTTVGVNLAARLEDRNYPGRGTSDIFSDMRMRSPVLYPLVFPDASKIPGEPYGQSRNPYQELAHSGYTSEHHTTVQSNIEIKQDLKFLTEGLNLKLMFSFDSYTKARIQRTIQPRPYMIVPWGYDAQGNPVLINDEGEYNYVDQEPASTTYHTYLKRESDRPETDRTVYLEGQLNYSRVFGLHNVGAMLLYNQNDYLKPSDENIYNSVPKRYQGLTGRTTYAYNNRYFFEFNFGYNGSENFASGKRYGFFPAVAVGWVPSEESFFDFAKPAIEYLKLRFSHGQVGNDQIGSVAGVSRFAYLTRVQETDSNVGFGTNNGFGYGSGKGISITYYGSPDATWETATKTDLGIDLRFLNGWRLQADVFYEKRENIWTALQNIPSMFGTVEVSGVPAIGGNMGEMENKGLDGFLEYDRRLNDDWRVNVKGTFSYARNKVLKNAEAKPVWDYQDKVGRRHNLQLGYIAERLFIDEFDVKNSPDQSYLGGTSKPGDIKYRDFNEDGVIDNFDQVFQGHPTVPEITYGIGAGATYKNFDLYLLFQGASNVSFYAKPKAFDDTNRGNVYTYIRDNRWTEETQDMNAKIPRPAIGTQNKNYVNSTWWLEDGKYLRLKQAEIGYTLPKSLTNEVGIKQARIYANGVNLFTLSPFKLWDAESKNSTGMYYPIQRVFNFGLEVNF
ncbi:MAG: TonB-dependent receptor [Odoribacteraceae bacterium]|jgi:TonB-linked SusC/RagA family outer membrane protein|nr:TonB-dependent receptor [Odoribacteraceae bacterium]